LLDISKYCFDHSKICPVIIQNQILRDFGNEPFNHYEYNY
jgi:hypothetical protein